MLSLINQGTHHALTHNFTRMCSIIFLHTFIWVDFHAIGTFTYDFSRVMAERGGWRDGVTISLIIIEAK